MFYLLSNTSIAQIINPGISDSYDSLENGKISIGGYIDTYISYDFNRPASKNRNYAYSSSRLNEFNINLAYIDVKYKNNRVRAHLAPGFGTFLNENYPNEKQTLQNIVEANAGIKISKKREIWIDAGVLSSPYTNESAISKDHLMYSRSFGAENVPYYFYGAKISIPINAKLNVFGYLINSWDSNNSNNKYPNFGTQLEYRPNKKALINWDTFFGNESSHLSIEKSAFRYFTDLYLVYKPNQKWGITTCAYIGGLNKVYKINNSKNTSFTGQANFTAAYYTKKEAFYSARIEYFLNQFTDNFTPTNNTEFRASSLSLAYNLKISSHALFRIENRFYYSDKNVFDARSGKKNVSNLLLANLTVWF